MRRTINVFTSLIFIYSMIVCATCKQVSPDKVGKLEFDALTYESVETIPLKQTKQTPAAKEISFSTAGFFVKPSVK